MRQVAKRTSVHKNVSYVCKHRMQDSVFKFARRGLVRLPSSVFSHAICTWRLYFERISCLHLWESDPVLIGQESAIWPLSFPLYGRWISHNPPIWQNFIFIPIISRQIKSYFNPEDGGSIFLRNIVANLEDCTLKTARVFEKRCPGGYLSLNQGLVRV